MTSCSCQTQDETIKVYACSGCADVGEIADQISRKLRRDGFASSSGSCLAGIGAGLTSFIDVAKTADAVITIDGCEICCAKITIENIDVQPRTYILTDMGLQKGNAPISTELVASLCDTIRKTY